jgi:hypothetical protein
MSVGAIEPVGIMKGSSTKPRKTNATTNAMTSEITVSLMEEWGLVGVASAPGLVGVSVEVGGMESSGVMLARPAQPTSSAGGLIARQRMNG